MRRTITAILSLIVLTFAASTVSATEGGGHTPVTVCHILGNGSYIELTFDDDALQAHKDHGDIYPVPANGCPVPTETPTEVVTETPTEVPTGVPTEVVTETPTDVPTEVPTEEPTVIPTTPPTEAPRTPPRPTVPDSATPVIPTEEPTTPPTVPNVPVVPTEPTAPNTGTDEPLQSVYPDQVQVTDFPNSGAGPEGGSNTARAILVLTALGSGCILFAAYRAVRDRG